MATKSILSNVTIKTSKDSRKLISSLEKASRNSKDKRVTFTKECDYVSKDRIKDFFNADNKRV